MHIPLIDRKVQKRIRHERGIKASARLIQTESTYFCKTKVWLFDLYLGQVEALHL